MEALCEMEMSSQKVGMFLDRYLPYPEEGSGTPRKVDNVSSRREEIMEKFESDQALEPHTGYAMFNAVTDCLDHSERGVHEDTDEAYIVWDGLFGGRDRKKQDALVILNSMAAAA